MFNKFSITCFCDWFSRIWTVLTALWFVLSYFNIMPFYQARLIKVNSVTPIIFPFPGQKIRLGINSYDNSIDSDVSDVHWELIKGERSFEFAGSHPTITLPPEGGFYQLIITVNMLSGEVKYGHDSLYIVQDSPVTVHLTKPTQLKISASGTDQALFENISSPLGSIDVYSGNGQWVKATKISVSKQDAVFELKPMENISTFNNQIIIRASGFEKQLNKYGSVQMPALMNQNQ
jgi:hypothetical protein